MLIVRTLVTKLSDSNLATPNPDGTIIHHMRQVLIQDKSAGHDRSCR
jgi:hypothetical protein